MPWSLPFIKVNLEHYFYEQVRKNIFSPITMFASDVRDDKFSHGNTYTNFNYVNSLFNNKEENV